MVMLGDIDITLVASTTWCFPQKRFAEILSNQINASIQEPRSLTNMYSIHSLRWLLDHPSNKQRIVSASSRGGRDHVADDYCGYIF